MRFQFCLAYITTAFIMHSRKDYFTLVSLSLQGEISSPVYSTARFFKHHLFTFATYSTSFPSACFIIYFERFLCLHEATKNWSKVNIWAVLRRVLRCFSLFIHGSDIKKLILRVSLSITWNQIRPRSLGWRKGDFLMSTVSGRTSNRSTRAEQTFRSRKLNWKSTQS